MSGSGDPEKISDIFSKENCSYISGNGNPRKLILQEVTFWGLKKFLIFQEVTCKAWKSKISYTFSDKETKFSKLKYFPIIILKRFFSFFNIYFYTEQAFVFHFWEIFITFTTILSLFFLFFFRKILISFASILYFLNNI